MERSGRLLVIDTATESLSVALFEGETLIGHHHEIAGRGHAEKLMPAIAALPNGGRADEIWVDSGPGSFTGIRVGLAAARALGFVWNIKLQTYSSLSLLAAMAQTNHDNDEPVSIALTGGHGELFWQQYDAHTLEALGPATSMPINALAQATKIASVYGTGARALVEARGYGQPCPLYPDARSALLLPAQHFNSEARAYYGRDADAVPTLPDEARMS